MKYFVQRMVDERINQMVRHISFEPYFIPIFLIPVPCPLDAVVAVTEVDGIVGGAFQYYPVSPREVQTGKNFVINAEENNVVAKSGVLRSQRLGQTVGADLFNIHDRDELVEDNSGQT